MTRFVTKATPIDCINGKHHIKKLKSSRTCLTGYSVFISCEKFLIAWGWTHTYTQTRQDKTHTSNLKKPDTADLALASALDLQIFN